MNEPDRVDAAFLPADVDQNGTVSPFDLLAFRLLVNNGTLPEACSDVDLDCADTDRNGEVSPFDLLRFRQPVNGLTPSTREWAGATCNNTQPQTGFQTANRGDRRGDAPSAPFHPNPTSSPAGAVDQEGRGPRPFGNRDAGDAMPSRYDYLCAILTGDSRQLIRAVLSCCHRKDSKAAGPECSDEFEPVTP